MADFDSSGEVIPTIFINLDEDLPGDNEFDLTALNIKPRVDIAAASTAAATASAASPAASTASVPAARAGNDGEERPAVWCTYNPNNDQAAGIADEYVRAKNPSKALHKIYMDIDLYLDLAGIRVFTEARQ